VPDLAPPTRTATAIAPAPPAPAPVARARGSAPAPQPTVVAPPAVRLGQVGSPTGLPDQVARVVASPGPGDPLPAPVQVSLERSLGVPLASVRVHTDARSAAAAEALGARAFAFGPHIFLGATERATDVSLMAHEAAHVVQQRGAPVVHLASTDANDAFEREAQRAATAAVGGESLTVRERVSSPRVQRLGISDAFDYFADKANVIPGFRMFTIILGLNPINMSRVERSAANILRALVEILPGGALISQALDNHGVFDKVGAWIEEQINTLGLAGNVIRQAVVDFVKSLSLDDLWNLGDVWNRAKRIFTDPIDRITTFAKGLITGIITFVKDAILRPLAKLAEGTAGYDLLKAVLGKDPITGDPFPRTPETLIGGFMKLIGQEEVWKNMQQANAVAKAWAWFQTTLGQLLGFVQQLPSLFVNALKALELVDIILVPKAFAKLVGVFGDFAAKFATWAGNAVWQLLEIIFTVVAPGAIPYLKKAAGALKSIFKNPIGFVGNLVRASKQGFQQFADNIGKHLKASLINWLTGSLSGVYIPKSLTFVEIVKFVFSVLGLAWQNIRQKLVKLIGEPAVKALELGFEIVTVLVTQGPAAAWEKIKETLGNLQEMAMQAIMDYVTDTVVKKAVAKIISMLIPGGAFVQAIVTIYDTIMVFISKLQTIIQVATAFLDGIMAIAEGSIGPAANKVEKTLAGLLTLAISFLAGFAGLGKIADKVMDIIKTKVRAPIDKALDKVADWIVTTAKKLFAKAFGKDQKTPAGDTLKARIKGDLLGKRIEDAKQGDALLTTIFGKYKGDGLKGIKLVVNSAKPDSVGVLVSASVAEIIANLSTSQTDVKLLEKLAKNFIPYTRKTNMYVTYNGGQRFPPTGGPFTNRGRHAETAFLQKLPALIELIEQRRNRTPSEIKAPPGQPVPVVIDINRTPCDGCAPLLAAAASKYAGVIKLTINASSVYKADWRSIELTSVKSVIAMQNAGIELNALKIWDVIKQKLQAAGVQELQLGKEYYDLNQWTGDFESKQAEVQGLLESAERELRGRGSLTKVAPKGTT
jgi:Domain of unknown function (DUF4157)/APOBEC-like N-terminal domain